MFNTTKFKAVAVVALMSAASPALACYGNACPTNNPSLPSTPSFSTGFTIQTMFSGNTQAVGEGFGDTVRSESVVNDLFTMNSFGDLTVDPNCSAECGAQTFGIDFTAQQQAGNFVSSFSEGHGTVSSGARSMIAGQFNAAAQFIAGTSGM